MIDSLRTLLRGDVAELGDQLRQGFTPRLLAVYLLAIIVGCGLYGFAIGLWRAPLLGVYVGVKMPLLIFCTLLVNGLINGLLAQVLGSGLSFRQTLTAILMCFAIFGVIVGSLSPIVIGMVLDAPPPSAPNSEKWYRMILLTHTAVIAAAGVISNVKLLRLIQHFAGDSKVGKRTFVAWLAGNLFVGAQLSYVLRPFFGNPAMKVEFLRSNPFEGNFYEAVWFMLKEAVGPGFFVLFFALLIVMTPFLILVELIRYQKRKLKSNP